MRSDHGSVIQIRVRDPDDLRQPPLVDLQPVISKISLVGAELDDNRMDIRTIRLPAPKI